LLNEDEIDGTCSTHREMKDAHKILVGNSEDKRVWKT